MTNIYLVRHGETEWNKTMRFQGSSDIELNDTGYEQANILAKRLSGIDFTSIYSSDLKRAIGTASAVAGEKKMIIEPNLKEMHFGDWEGLTFEQIKAEYPGELDKFYIDPTSADIPGNETFLKLQQRACKAFYNIAQSNEDNVLIVSHGATIRVILADILQIPLAKVWNIRQDNVAINVISRYAEKYTVGLINYKGSLIY